MLWSIDQPSTPRPARDLQHPAIGKLRLLFFLSFMPPLPRQESGSFESVLSSIPSAQSRRIRVRSKLPHDGPASMWTQKCISEPHCNEIMQRSRIEKPGCRSTTNLETEPGVRMHQPTYQALASGTASSSAFCRHRSPVAHLESKCRLPLCRVFAEKKKPEWLGIVLCAGTTLKP